MPVAKLKIGFVFDDTLDSADGVAQYVKTLGSWLSGQGHEVRYLVGETKATEWSGDKIYSLSKNFKVKFNGNRMSIPGPASKRRIKEVLTTEKFDVLHIMMPYSPFMAAKVIKAAPAGTAIVGTFHIFPSGWLSRIGSRLLRLWLWSSSRKIHMMLAVSQASADFAASSYGWKTAVVPNAVDIARFVQEKKAEQDGIVFLGRLVKRKGCLELLKAYELLIKDLPGTGLKIISTGSQEAMLEKYAQDHSLDHVEFLGFVSEEEKARQLSSAAVACFPALYGEAFGIVLIEAMAAGAGVVLGGDNPGYRSVLAEQEQLLVDPRDTEAFAERLKLLLTDKELAAKLHDWQTESVRQYDVNVVGGKVLDIYNQAIALRNKNEHNKH